jgi:hypothetical protein
MRTLDEVISTYDKLKLGLKDSGIELTKELAIEVLDRLHSEKLRAHISRVFEGYEIQEIAGLLTTLKKANDDQSTPVKTEEVQARTENPSLVGQGKSGSRPNGNERVHRRGNRGNPGHDRDKPQT